MYTRSCIIHSNVPSHTDRGGALQRARTHTLTHADAQARAHAHAHAHAYTHIQAHTGSSMHHLIPKPALCFICTVFIRLRASIQASSRHRPGLLPATESSPLCMYIVHEGQHSEASSTAVQPFHPVGSIKVLAAKILDSLRSLNISVWLTTNSCTLAYRQPMSKLV